MNSLPHSKALEAEIKAFCAESHLTPRETEIMSILVEGVVRIKDVADRLKLSPNTVNNHVNSIFMKTRTRSKSQLLAGLLNHVAEELERSRFFRQTPRVMVLERDAYASAHLTDSLEKRGFKVTVAPTQSEFDARLTSVAPNFVLVDLALLVEPANSFIKRVTDQIHPSPHIVLMGSGHGVGDSAQAMHLGAIDLFSRPVDVNQLYQTLMSHYIEDEKDRARFLQASGFEAKAVLEDVSITRENVGTGGILISGEMLKRILQVPIGIGDQVELKLKLGSEDMTPARGQVVWMRGEELGGGAGVRFVNLSRRDRDRLMSFVRENSIRCYIPGGVTAAPARP